MLIDDIGLFHKFQQSLNKRIYAMCFLYLLYYFQLNMQTILRRFVCQIPKVSGNPFTSNNILSGSLMSSSKHELDITSKRLFGMLSSTISSALGQPSSLLRPSVPLTNQLAGFKVKAVLKRRCKDCYFVTRHERMYVICPTHGRHKQMAMVEKPHNTWILTHATQGKKRPW